MAVSHPLLGVVALLAVGLLAPVDARRSLMALTVASASRAAGTQPGSSLGEVPTLGPEGCPWASVSGQRLLDWKLTYRLASSRAKVEDIVTALQQQYHIPISFIAADEDSAVVVTMRDGSLGQLLDRLVAQSPVYRYRFIGARLVLLPVDARWETPINELRIAAPQRRWEMGQALVSELRRRLPLLATLNPPWLVGNPADFIYHDQVSLSLPATVVELFTQVLGTRPSASFMVSKRGGATTTFWLTSADLVRSLELSVPAKAPHPAGEPASLRPGETLQLQVVATLQNGDRQSLTRVECGTVYTTDAPQVLRLAPDGRVTAVGSGEAVVVASNENATATLLVKVVPPSPPGGRPKPARTMSTETVQ